MDNERFSSTSSPSPFQAPTPEGILHWMCLNEQGLRSGWRLLIYAAFVALLGFGGAVILQHFIHLTRGGFSFGYSFTYEVFSFVVVFCAALIMSRIEGRPPGSFGLPLKQAFWNFFCQAC